jgi:hypothetical protein
LDINNNPFIKSINVDYSLIKIPKKINPKNFKDQDLGDWEPPASGNYYCGSCGKAITPEELSMMSHSKYVRFGKHDLFKYGIYGWFFDYKHKIHEGWYMRGE